MRFDVRTLVRATVTVAEISRARPRTVFFIFVIMTTAPIGDKSDPAV